MDLDSFRKRYGEEYPAAVVWEGTRMPLVVESRFSRDYRTPESEMKTAKCGGTIISRFWDGSASMTADQLRGEWPTLTKWERLDFCQECGWLHKQADFPEMLRFIMQHGGPDDWVAIACKTATNLPAEEAFHFLAAALEAQEAGKCGNIIQAIAITKHPDAKATLRQHLQTVWDNPTLWNDDSFLNWVARDSESCIQHLIELGAVPADFDEQVRRLSEHVCKGNREDCRRWLSKHYSWLN
jgi:hypothetical protein